MSLQSVDLQTIGLQTMDLQTVHLQIVHLQTVAVQLLDLPAWSGSIGSGIPERIGPREAQGRNPGSVAVLVTAEQARPGRSGQRSRLRSDPLATPWGHAPLARHW